MKKMTWLIFSIFLVAVMYHTDIGRVRFDSTHDGEQVPIHMNIRNTGYDDLEGVSVTISVPELDIWYRTNAFDVYSGDNVGRYIFADIPKDMAKEEMLVRIVVQNDDVRKVRHIPMFFD